VDLPEAAGPSMAMMEGLFLDTNYTDLKIYCWFDWGKL
jgi:hypothetical protein